jgi:hypothetical protein
MLYIALIVIGGCCLARVLFEGVSARKGARCRVLCCLGLGALVALAVFGWVKAKAFAALAMGHPAAWLPLSSRGYLIAAVIVIPAFAALGALIAALVESRRAHTT